MTAASSSTAQELAQFLGAVKTRVDSYNEERKQLANSLRQIATNAQQLLSELGEPATAGRSRGRPAGKRGPGRPKGTGRRRGRRKGSKLSAEARAKIAAAILQFHASAK